MNEVLAKAASQFIDSCGREYEFPAGGSVEILTPQELELLEEMNQADISELEKVGSMMHDRDWSDCYSLAIFGVRLGILGVRSRNQETYRLGLLAMLAASTKLDLRDTLGALAIFEDCGRRLGIGLQSEIERISMPIEDCNLRSVIDGFFSRDEQMRSVDVMGLTQVGDGDELTFKPRSML